MKLNDTDVLLGFGVIAFGVLLLTFAIPNYITSPSNVRALVLSPTFWPIIVAGIIVFMGALLAITRMFGIGMTAPESTDALPNAELDGQNFAWLRLVGVAVLMIGLVMATPILGMVLATGIAFVAFAVIVQAPKPILIAVSAVVIPLVLYWFFNHIAGVSVPQGRFFVLP